MRIHRGCAIFACVLLLASACARQRAEAPTDSASPGLSPSGDPIRIPRLAGEPRITAEIPFPGGEMGGGGVAVGAGSAWIGFASQGEQGESDSVLRIDLATNEIVAQIPVTGAPSRKRIAATDDAVWVASTGVIERIDPATNTVVASVEIPDRSISAIAVDPSAVWAVTIDRSVEGTLVRVDPVTNEIVGETPLGPQIAGYEDEVLLGAESVWVLGVRWFEHEDAEYGSDLIRVDPVTNAIVARIPIGGFQMAVGAEEVWVRFPADGVFDSVYAGERGERWLWTRVDIGTNEPSEPFRFEDGGLQLVTPGALWSVGYDEQLHVRVTRFDPETLEVEERSEPIRSYYHDALLDPSSASVWVSAFDIVRFDIG